MTNRNASLDDFFQWYEENQESLVAKGQKSKLGNAELHKEFLKEWPLMRLETMSLDDYVIGKGADNQSFCYQIEQGKYKNLYMGIRGGSASKFGIYWSKGKNAYLDQANHIISDNDLANQFSKLKEDLLAILRAGISFDFDNSVFNSNKGNNSFFNRSSIITKLLVLYNPSFAYFGVNNSKTEFWEKLIPLDSQGGVYKQNYQLTQVIQNRYPELDGATLGTIIHDYYRLFTGERVEALQEKNNYIMEVERLKKSRNLILRGAPGTGKTYLARQIAEALTDGNEEQIGFVQFHPSYDYTDFVEGLRPVPTEDSQIGFELQDGIFREFCERAKKNWMDSRKAATLLEIENNSRAKLSQFFDNMEFPSQEFPSIRNRFFITAIDDNYIYISIPENEVSKQFKLSIRDIEQMLISGKDFKLVKDITHFFRKNNATQAYSYYLALFNLIKKEKVKKIHVAQQNELKNFVFIIDEINRGEISKIFGELFFSIDPGYRGEKGKVTTQYANMRQTDKEFYIPENVYIIGTMNDIDRSVDTFDFAMRRRFRFVEVTAESQIHMLDELGDVAEEAKSRLRNLNQAISEVEGLNSHYHIGPSYFLKLKDLDDDFDVLWSDYLDPLLEDYLRGSYDEVEKLKELEKAYNSVEKDESDETDR